MSCFIMSDQAHAATANTLEYILNSGFNRFGFDAPDSLYKALSDCRDRYGFYCSGLIFRRLYDLNSRAYAGRYKTDADTTPPEMPSVPPLVQEREREDQHEKLLPWHYKLAKLIDCEIYQASEDATRKDPLLLALIDFSRVYTHFLVSNTAEGINPDWKRPIFDLYHECADKFGRIVINTLAAINPSEKECHCKDYLLPVPGDVNTRMNAE